MKDERVLAQLSAHQLSFFAILVVAFGLLLTERIRKDRKSTRLNSSHANISYAVFCLKKKKTTLVDEVDASRDLDYIPRLNGDRGDGGVRAGERKIGRANV